MKRLEQNNSNDLEEVFKRTNNGLTVFQQEIPDFTLTSNVKNPFTAKDNNPSCRIKCSSSGIYLLYVYNDEGGYYNCIQFISKLYSLSFPESIKYILNKDSFKTLKRIETKVIEKEPLFFDFKKQPYTEKHIEYFCIQGLTEKFLVEEMDIYAVKEFGINRIKKKLDKGQFMFAYVYKNIMGKYIQGNLKFLRLGNNVDKKDKWRTNLLPYNFFYTYKIKPNTTVFVCKSNKDAAITQFLGITSIAVLSENYHNILTGLQNLMTIFPTVNFVLNLGTDAQGKDTSIRLSKALNLKWFNTPNYALREGINDNFSYVQKYGMNSFKKLLKNKKYL